MVANALWLAQHDSILHVAIRLTRLFDVAIGIREEHEIVSVLACNSISL
jgi:hypothetical protein